MQLDPELYAEGEEPTSDKENAFRRQVAAALKSLTESNFVPDTLIDSDRVPDSISKYGGELLGPLFTNGFEIDGVSISDLAQAIKLYSELAIEIIPQYFQVSVTVNDGNGAYEINGPEAIVENNSIVIQSPEGYSGYEAVVHISQLGFEAVQAGTEQPGVSGTDSTQWDIIKSGTSVSFLPLTTNVGNGGYMFHVALHVLWIRKGSLVL